MRARLQRCAFGHVETQRRNSALGVKGLSGIESKYMAVWLLLVTLRFALTSLLTPKKLNFGILE